MSRKAVRYAASAALLGLSLWLFYPLFLGLFNQGSFFGGGFLLLCSAAAAFLPQLKGLLKKKALKIAALIVGIILAACFCWAAALSGFMINAALAAPADKAAPVIVLGCQVRKDKTPSLMLQRRIEAAAEYLLEYPDAVCVASGGQGGDEPLSEAQAIYDGLVSLGVSPDRIIKEDKSTSTGENLEFSLKLLREKGFPTDRAVIVTDGFHQFRAHIMAENQGCTAYSINSATPPGLFPAYWVREWLGVSHYLVFGS